MNISTLSGRILYRIMSKFHHKTPKYTVSTPIEEFSNTYLGNNMVDSGTLLMKCVIGQCTYLSFDCVIQKTKIGKYCSIGPRVCTGFSTHPTKKWVTTHPAFYMNIKPSLGYSFHENNIPLFNPYKEVSPGFLCEIGNDVWIGADVKIMDGVKIGNGAIVAAGSVVIKDVEPYSIVAGIPAKLIRYRFDDIQIDFLEQFKWWDKPINWIKENYLDFKDIQSFVDNNKFV